MSKDQGKPRPAWGQVSYKKVHVLRDSGWNPDDEKGVYDSAFYDNDAADIAAARPFVRRFFLSELGEWSSCCDLGTGMGLWMRALADDGKDVIGVDFSDGAKERNVLAPLGRYLHADLTQPLQLNRSFDIVTTWEVFEHLPRSVHPAFLDNITALRPKVLIASCAGMRVHGRDFGQLNPKLEKQKGRHHYSCMPLREFAAVINERGFEVDGVLSCIWRQIPKLPAHYRQNTLVFRAKE